MKRGNDMIKRINITIDEDLLNKIEFYSKKRYLTRSGFISLAVSTFLDHVAYLDHVENIPDSSASALKPSSASDEV